MSKKLSFERYFWFHNQLKNGKFLNASHVAQEFEISLKQAQRDIEFMRDRLFAPLQYDKKRRGYYYDSLSYEIPSIWIKEDELLALCFATRLASSIPQDEIKRSLELMIKKLSSYITADLKKFERFINNVSVKNIEYYIVDKTIFHEIISSLFNEQTIEFDYYSPHNKERTHRVIKPLHLLYYMGRWFLIGYCKDKAGIRYFSLSRISSIKVSEKDIDVKASFDIKAIIDSYFGIFCDGTPQEVCLRFSPHVSDWVSEQVWHEGQKMNLDNEGRLTLRFPATNFSELKGEILKFGSSVEVISPDELRLEIKEEIKKMHAIYK
ncbi:MAG: WYL domain-containing protein [Thermodesulfovibrionales bacterium]|nr:WYL domain-containing protein [Thermodesulfovibrionales bacterium]